MASMLGPRLDLRQSQSLVMTPQLRQAIKLLQSSNMEVMAFVDEELERNPLLERDEARLVAVAAEAPPPDAAAAASADTFPEPALDADYSNVVDAGEAHTPDFGPVGSGGRADFSDDLSGIEEMAGAGPSLRERLAEQLRLNLPEGQERLIGAALLAMVEPSGRLTLDADAMAARLGCDVAVVERVRRAMQRFEPVGMFCRDLRECLQVQLEEQGRYDPYMARLLDHLPLLARRDMRGLMEACGVDSEDLAEMVAELRRLDPKPGAGADDTPLQTIQPDVLMRPSPEGGWVLELNPETLPRVLVNRGFAARAVVNLRDREQKTFLAEQLQSANWLVKSLEQRANTILKVAGEIIRRQDAFFRHGVEHLRPLILRDVAEAVEMHESTVSRVTANKYLATPRGTLELKYFFTTAIAGTAGGESVSAEAVRHRIRGMISAETPCAILSDDAIVLRLREEGVDIARRTVAKYREAMRIPSSVQRKREKAVTA
ncbi:RNA polymerase factor sigma-54 [Roseococcus thiosulfatophilus]|uniref:RNA polymerase factor sigma-54 n=1 Tax=Roseococcus thiosulfatophilus TaxID=35813 RepID=UPI001A8DEAAB|nr:RNA polymerase factor sigma-54 [Roseococcus thiosulfatophilus]